MSSKTESCLNLSDGTLCRCGVMLGNSVMRSVIWTAHLYVPSEQGRLTAMPRLGLMFGILTGRQIHLLFGVKYWLLAQEWLVED